jgi:hypothetical protein
MLAKMDSKIGTSQEKMGAKINTNQERQEAKMDSHHGKLMVIMEAS